MVVASALTTLSLTDRMLRLRVNTWAIVGPPGAIPTLVVTAATLIGSLAAAIVTTAAAVTQAMIVTEIGTLMAVTAGIGVIVAARLRLVVDGTLLSTEGAGVTRGALPEVAAQFAASGTTKLPRLPSPTGLMLHAGEVVGVAFIFSSLP